MVETKFLRIIFIFLVAVIIRYACFDSYSLQAVYDLYPDTNLLNQVFSVKKASSLMACSMLCIRHNNCSASTYLYARKDCNLMINWGETLQMRSSVADVTAMVIKPCFKNPPICMNDATCLSTNNNNGFECVCKGRWESTYCDVAVSWCYNSNFEYNEEAKLCYYSGDRCDDFDDAVTQCKNLNGTLAIGNTELKVTAILNISKKYKSWHYVNLVKKDNVWKWGDGSTDSILWKPYQPSGDGNCSSSFPDGSGLNDCPCNTSGTGYICEQEAIY